MPREELLFETKYGAMMGYEVFVKYCETRDWELMDQVLHDDYMCVDELAVLNKEEMRQRSIDDKTRGFELLTEKSYLIVEDALIFSHPMKGDWGAYTAGEKYDEIIHVCLKKDKKVWRENDKDKESPIGNILDRLIEIVRRLLLAVIWLFGWGVFTGYSHSSLNEGNPPFHLVILITFGFFCFKVISVIRI